MNVKYISISAAVGFILSFLVGIISKNTILGVFIKALIFAVLFALITLLISFLYSKFLNESSAIQDKELAPKQAKTGSNVDIVIQDENLEDTENSPKFVVKENPNLQSGKEEIPQVKQSEENIQQENVQKEKLEITDVPDEGNINQKNDNENTTFAPIDFSKSEKISASTEKENSTDSSGNLTQEVDTLPDIGDFNPDGKNSPISDIIDDSEFAGASSATESSNFHQSSEEPSIQNADVMAQAIRTLLAKDN